jgi:Apea-like HEPN
MSPPDPIADALADIARASFPGIYCLPADQPWQPPLVPRAPQFIPDFDQGRTQAFVDATANDSVLAQFPPLGGGPFITSSTGAGWRTNRSGLATGFVTSAAKYVSGQGKPCDIVEPLIEEAQNQLALFRSLASGNSEHVLMLTAYDGLPLQASTRLETPWGTLRPATVLDQWTLGRNAVMPTAVLESWVPASYTVGEPPADPSIDQAMTQHSARARERIPLCGLLLSTEHRLFAPGFVWQTVVLPGETGGASFGAHAPTDLEAPSGDALTGEQEADLARWATAVDGNYDESIAVAVRRVTSAIRERWDRADSLIDAVVAWENLFGGKDVMETTFRITSALAILLEPNPADRIGRRKELAKVYDVRSRVLHGGQLRPQDDLEGKRDIAIQVAIAALRLLLSERSDLLPHADDRAVRLILGAS